MKNGIKLYKITDEVAEYYQLNVRGNEETPIHMIVRKLTRNILLSKRLDNDENGNEVYLYGQLAIIVNRKTHTIVEIGNYTQGVKKYWHKNMVKYNMLNKVLGITEGLDRIVNVM